GVTAGVNVGGGKGGGAFFTLNLRLSPVPEKDMEYRLVPPSRLSTTVIVAEPLGTEKGRSLATTLSNPAFTLAIFTADGPPGAEAFLYFKRAPEPLVLQKFFGRPNVTGPLPSSKLTEESAPPTGSEPAMLMPGSFESRTSLPVLSNSFFPVMPW